MKKDLVTTLYMALGLLGVIALPATGQSQYFESYFLYIDDYPSYKEPGWHEDVQGITCDGAYWYITQSDPDGRPEERSLWKIPVKNNLADDARPGVNGVSRIILDDIPEFGNGCIYDHFGDLTYYFNEHDNKGYLVIPVTDSYCPLCLFDPWQHCPCPSPCPDGNKYDPIIAVFEASNLSYVGHAVLNQVAPQSGAGWCAVDPKGFVCTSNSKTNFYYKYKLRWDLVPNNQVILEGSPQTIPFLDESNNPLTITNMQGGAFSKSGDLLYVSSGYFENDSSPTPTDGINVFDTKTHRRVAHSINGGGHFNYEWDWNCHFGDYQCEEPEGLTVFDLDYVESPNVFGQLHVLLLDNDWEEADDVVLKHYTGTIWVDGINGEDANLGRLFDPLKTITAVNHVVNVLNWNGVRINIKAGLYPETLTFSHRMQVLAVGGPVIIGETGGAAP